MPRASKESAPRRLRRHRDPGLPAGSVAALIVLGIWGLSSVSFDLSAEEDPAVTMSPSRPSTPPAENVTIADSLEDVSTPSPPLSPRKWERDERWVQALEQGEGGLKLMKDTREWHEKEGGDPFRYRSQMREARGMLEKSVEQLRTLLTDFESDARAKRAIEARVSQYSKPLGDLRKES